MNKIEEKDLEQFTKKYSNRNEFLSKEYIGNDVQILQDNEFFKFGVDSIMLSRYFKDDIKNFKSKNINVLDVCSGTGIVGLNFLAEAISDDTKLKNINLDFCEKQEYFSYLNYLNLKDFISKYDKLFLDKNISFSSNVFNEEIGSLKNDPALEKYYDYIIINPPYMKKKNGVVTPVKEKEIAKVQEDDFLDSFFKTCKRILKDNGKIYMVYRSERLQELICSAKNNGYTLKNITMITRKESKKGPNIFCCKIALGKEDFLEISKTIYL